MRKEIKDGLVAWWAPCCLGIEMSAAEMLERDERILGPEAIDNLARYIDMRARVGGRVEVDYGHAVYASRFGTEGFWCTLFMAINFEVEKIEAKHKNWNPSIHTKKENDEHEEWEYQEQQFRSRMGVHEVMGQVIERGGRISNDS